MNRQKGFIIPLIIIIAAIIIIGGGLYIYKEDEQADLNATSTTIIVPPAASTTEPVQPTPAPVPPTAASGIKGNVTIGPTCPVQHEGESCEAPYATTFNVLTLDGQFVKTFSSDANGDFTVSLSPGKYKIEQRRLDANPSAYPKMSVVDSVTVNVGAYTTVNITFDSGIR